MADGRKLEERKAIEREKAGSGGPDVCSCERRSVLSALPDGLGLGGDLLWLSEPSLDMGLQIHHPTASSQ